MNTQLKYVGSWQHGSTVLQKLDGPIGDGAVYYPNGDRFKGYWVYTGEVKDNRPEGNGLLVGDYSHGNRRYEGDFREGVFVNKDVCTEKITLHVKSSENGRYKEYDMEAKLGKLGIHTGFNMDQINIE